LSPVCQESRSFNVQPGGKLSLIFFVAAIEIANAIQQVGSEGNGNQFVHQFFVKWAF